MAGSAVGRAIQQEGWIIQNENRLKEGAAMKLQGPTEGFLKLQGPTEGFHVG